jgi:GT2 family glycosyltransferase
MLLSVIIVSWNARDLLGKCLRSLEGSRGPYELQTIVVDNASTDGSPELVEKEFPAVQLIRSATNLGFSKANNLGLQSIRGEYVLLVNSDVELLPGCIPALVEHMRSHPRVGIAGPAMLDAQHRVRRSCRGFPTLWNTLCHALALDYLFPRIRPFGGYTLRHWNHDSTRLVEILGGWFWIVRREALAQVGGLDERFFFYAEDMDWCRQFANHGWQAAFVSCAGAIHFGGGSSQRAPLHYYIQQQRADLQYWRKHHGAWRTTCYRGVCLIYHGLRLAAGTGRLLLAPRNAQLRHRAHLNAGCLWWYLGGGN